MSFKIFKTFFLGLKELNYFRDKKILVRVYSYVSFFFSVFGFFEFIDNSKKSKTLCLIIAGHKPFIWNECLRRIKKYSSPSYDFIVISPGKRCDKIITKCINYNWSYLNTKRNNINLCQNIAIILHPNAEIIYKFDEDMLITKNFFYQTQKLYWWSKKNINYEIGIISSLININGYGYYRLLKKFNLDKKFYSLFGNLDITAGGVSINNFTKNPNVPIQLWSDNFYPLNDIDLIDERLSKSEFYYSICPIRYSIGAYLVERKIIQKMKFFKFSFGNGVSLDEIQLCNFLNTNSKIILISENTVIGHFCYGPQTNKMLEKYGNNLEIIYKSRSE